MVLTIIITGVIGFLTWYLFLPAMNIRSVETWAFVFFISFVFSLVNLIIASKNINNLDEDQRLKLYRKASNIFKIPLLVIGLTLIFGIFSSKIIHSKKYSKMVEVENGNFTEDIKEISFDQIPTVDRVTAITLGDRKMGEMLDLASQFNVSDAYTQIDYKDKAVRVTPLEYNGILKWLNNKSEGIPGYITVDMATGHTSLNKLDGNIKYSKSDKFSRDIKRHIRLKYPTRIISEISFEIDEDGKPFWIIPTYNKSIGVFGGTDVDRVLICNAVNGQVEEYEVEDVPTWVDRVYNADRIIGQVDNWGSLKDGFLNSKFSQKGVLKTTEGYNYLAIDDDVYLYTGITSASKDSSNMGFILSNLRTKETKFYEISSADEVSAMASAQGEVQEKQYISTFPILLNIDDKPTYMMALKDNAELIKAYAFVDAQDYQNVEVGSTIEDALKKYIGDVKPVILEEDKLLEVTLENISIKNLVIDGNTYYYILSQDEIFTIKGSKDIRLPFYKDGENIRVKYYVDDQGINIIEKIL